MNERFGRLVEEMPNLLKELEEKPLLTRDELYGIPEEGVYVFYENDRPLYVGRSNSLKSRIQQHGRQGSTHNSAPFAFNIAKEVMGREGKIPNITRADLEKAPGFKQAFFDARLRVSRMKVKVIKIEDQIMQTVFEVYAALSLDTLKYNEFGTH